MHRIVTVAWALALVLAWAGPARAQDIDPFEQAGVSDVKLWVNSADLAQLRATADQNTYYPADFEYRGVVVRNIGVRSRGLGSRNATKVGLRLDFNRYASGQRFAGQKAMVLDNLWQDPTMIRERLALRLYEAMGVPAPREVFVRVFINGEYQGLYALVEEINAQMLTRIGNDEGVLFEYKFLGPYRAQDLGTGLDPYVPLFEARTHESRPVETLYAPLRDLLAASGAATGESWRALVEPRLDLRQMLTYLAVETFTADNDGLLGYDGMNNFYLQRPDAGTQHQFLPWDKDQAFGDVATDVFLRTDENVLVRQALAFPDLREAYLAALQQVAGLADADGWLASEFEATAALVDEAARQDMRKQFDEATRAEALASLRAFIAARGALVRAQLDQVRATAAP
ncbi:CotH kinase family protein [Luteitalea sp.]|jgi:spore coat protein CotH|uniref:CotH kinase family protein n=1 Tax=Luteitalea sp. TaxID=2004800 RepID=UPI0037C80400